MKFTHLPPLNSLRAFEATARLGNVAAAANELGVSPSAVSQQITKLEAHLEIALFNRQANVINITSLGQNYFTQINDAFHQIHNATQQLQAPAKQQVLRVTTYASFATYWLLPRLPLFNQLHPNVQIEIITNSKLQDLENDNIDIGIRFGFGEYKKYPSQKLLNDIVTPVATPEIAAKINNVKDLKKQTLFKSIGMENHYENTWGHWLTNNGFSQTEIDALNFQAFSDGNLNIAAALNGQGVYLAHHAYVKELLQQKRLVNIFGGWQNTEYAFYLVKSKYADFNPIAQKFYHWLLAQGKIFDS